MNECFRSRKCRNPVGSSRLRRQVLAENLEKRWLELRGYATLEKDPQKLLELASELEKRGRSSRDGLGTAADFQLGK
jgi:hypothetical protein